jgi:hypothetical protein
MLMIYVIQIQPALPDRGTDLLRGHDHRLYTLTFSPDPI